MAKLAIAYAMKKKKKMAEGGEAEEKDKVPPQSPIDPDKAKQFSASFNRGKKYSAGGFVAEEKASGFEKHPGNDVKHNGPAHEEDNKELNQEPVDMNSETSVAMQGLVDRIMMQKSKDFDQVARLSHGGQVANDVGTGQEADKLPNQFDDMVLDGDEEFNYSGANSGDELGNEQEDEDRKDIVSRIMNSRNKKDKNPNPA